MQKFLAKYGLAAHLAILAVAPLFLYPLFASGTIATVLLWLSLPAFVWSLAEPSVRPGELLHEARRRVAKAAFRDPLSWIMLVLVLIVGFRALNSGVVLAYNAEIRQWFLHEPVFPLLPGSTAGSGYLPFAGALAAAVVVFGCRHALGRSARSAFLLTVSTLAGIAALLTLVLANQGNAEALTMAECRLTSASYVGSAYAVAFLASMVALVAAFEHRWRQVMPLFAFSIGGSLAGAMAFAPIADLAVFAVAAVLLLIYVFVYLSLAVKGSSEFKYLVVFGIAVTIGLLGFLSLMPARFVTDRESAIASMTLFPVGFAEMRAALSAIAFKVWKAHLWLGTGLGSFPIDIRFHATEADWLIILPEQMTALNGWWQMLAERGVVGMLVLLVPLGALFFTYCRRFWKWIFTFRLPEPSVWLGLLVTVPVLVCGFVDFSFMRVEMLATVGGVLAVSAGAFPREKR